MSARGEEFGRRQAMTLVVVSVIGAMAVVPGEVLAKIARWSVDYRMEHDPRISPEAIALVQAKRMREGRE